MAKAKRGGAFGMLRGSVGPVTYSIGLDGIGKKQQVVREKPVEVKNPRTRAQAIQRMKLKPIYNIERLLADIVDHSFKGVPVGVQSRQYFRKLAMTQQDVPFQIKGSLDVFPGGYQISEGSLGDTTATLQKSENAFSRGYSYMIPTTLGFSTVGTVQESTVSAQDYNTWAELSQALINLNPSLRNGDEIAKIDFRIVKNGSTFNTQIIKRRMVIDTNFTAETPANFFPGVNYVGKNVAYAAYLYNQEDFAKNGNAIKEAMISFQKGVNFFAHYLSIEPATDDNEAAAGAATQLMSMMDNASVIESVPQTAADITGASEPLAAATCFVISRLVDGAWNFTNADICMSKGALLLCNTQIQMEAAIASYMAEEGAKQASSNYFLRLATGEEKIAVSIFPIRATTQNQTITPTVIGGIDMESESGAKYLFTREVEGTTVVLDAPYGNVLTITVPPAEEGGQSTTVNVTPVMVYGLYEFVSENDIL